MAALGQNAKYQLRANVFRYAPMNEHRQARTSCLKSATSGLMRCNKIGKSNAASLTQLLFESLIGTPPDDSGLAMVRETGRHLME
jgi:hypothetical protein